MGSKLEADSSTGLSDVVDARVTAVVVDVKLESMASVMQSLAAVVPEGDVCAGSSVVV